MARTQYERIERWAELRGIGGDHASKVSAFQTARREDYAARHGLAPESAEARRGGRGHASTPEHGYSVSQVGQSVIVSMSGRDPLAKVGRALGEIERKDYGSRAALTVTKSNGDQVTLFKGAKTSGRQGFSVGGMQTAMNSGNFAAGMADLTNSPTLEDLLADAVEIQLEVF